MKHYETHPIGSTIFSPQSVLRRFLAAALTAILAIPAVAAPKTKEPQTQPPVGSSFSGKIVGWDGKPVRGAIVTVSALDSDSKWTSLPSDKWGKFRLAGLHYGWAEVAVTTDDGIFLGDQAMNLPPGKKVTVNFSLIETKDKPASWWADRRVERPVGDTAAEIGGMAQSSQTLHGVEYWKSPKGIAVLVGVGVLALGLIAYSGRSYRAPAQ